MRRVASTRAIEPPPAPISTISITGMRTGRPLPLTKRCRRSTSNWRDRVAACRRRSGRSWRWCRPCRTTARARGRIRAAIRAARMAPPAGPDSTRRIGNRAARRERRQAAARGHQEQRAGKPAARAAPARAARGSPRSAAARRRWRTAVEKRSYSRISGQTSEDSVTQSPAARRAGARRAPLVRGVGIAVQEADRDALDARAPAAAAPGRRPRPRPAARSTRPSAADALGHRSGAARAAPAARA